MAYPDAIRFAYGKTLSGVRTTTRSWGQIVASFTKGHKPFPDKASSLSAPNILGGATDDKGKEERNVLSRSLLTIDYDGFPPDTQIEDVEFALEMSGYAAIGYSTFRHGIDGNIRLRIIVPLKDEIAPWLYPIAARAFVDEINLGEPDACSFVIAQIMFMPSCMEGYEDHAWSFVTEGKPFGIAAFEGMTPSDFGPADDTDDLIRELAYEPIDMTDAEVDKALQLYPAEHLDYDEWLAVGLALWHQYRGDKGDAGFGRWLRWSEKSPKHDAQKMMRKWKSGGGRSQPITMASVIAKVGGWAAIRDDDFDELPETETAGDAPTLPKSIAILEPLLEQAEAVESLQDYEAIKRRVSRIGERHLGSDLRAMVSEAIYTTWGRGAGIGKTDIRKALAAPKVGARAVPAPQRDQQVALTADDCYNEDAPWWLRGWIYDERDAEFVDIETGHAIKREAFRMKFDRMPECADHETDAANIASKIHPIPTISGRMYWPGFPLIFQHEGLSFLNTWRQDGAGGVPPAPEGSFAPGDDSIEGQAVKLFLDHLENLVTDQRERDLMLDWMSWVYAKPGSRVRWALLLWGVEGNGKSYFHRILTQLMGRDSRTVAASSIEERFTGWAEGCRLVGIEEIRVSGTNKWRTMDKMKPFISNDYVEVEKKGKDARTVPNFASYMLFTNHMDAIPVGDGDRRYFVIFTKHETKDQLIEEYGDEVGLGAYFQKLFDVSLAGVAGIGRYLLDRQYTEEFDPHGRAPHSQAKRDMQAMSASAEDEALIDALEKFAGPWINDKVIDLTHLQTECAFETDIELPKTTILSRKLGEMGYRKAGRVKARGKNRTIWYRRSMLTEDEAIGIIRGEDYNDVPF
jgi:hypothetical protein